MADLKHQLAWHLFADLLENRARELKAKGLDGSAIALIGASADATAVAKAIEEGLLECDGVSVEQKPS